MQPDNVDTHQFITIDDARQKLSGTIVKDLTTGAFLYCADVFAHPINEYYAKVYPFNNLKEPRAVPIRELSLAAPTLGIFEYGGVIYHCSRSVRRQFKAGIPPEEVRVTALSDSVEGTPVRAPQELIFSKPFFFMLANKYPKVKDVVSTCLKISDGTFSFAISRKLWVKFSKSTETVTLFYERTPMCIWTKTKFWFCQTEGPSSYLGSFVSSKYSEIIAEISRELEGQNAG